MKKFIRTKYGKILELEKTSECIFSIRNKNVDSENCYVSYLWDNWRAYFLIDYQNCMLFSYNSAQNFISNLIKENLNYRDLVIELSPYYKDCKQANTIEELCDAVVIKQTNTKTNVTWYADYPMEYYQMVKCMIDNHLDYIRIDYVKFGIWNDDKGLIYVAKINENGGFDLI